MTDRSAEEPDRVVIRDNRKIDPVTGQARKHAGGVSAPPAGAPREEEDVSNQTAVFDENAKLLDERTADLQRLQAEYANYRKRAERDRLAAGDLATSRVLAELLPVIDDLDRVKAHDDLTGPLKSVSDKLDGVFAKLGLTPFGAVGDPFDPSIHDAVLHDESDAVSVPTCTTIMRQGYLHNDRLLRPAMVGVSDPSTKQEPAETQGEAPQEADPNETHATPEQNISAEGDNKQDPQG